MKKCLLVSLFLIALIFYSRAEKMRIGSLVSPTTDSTLKQRFIASVLNEYEEAGRWVFTKIVRCDGKYRYEIVEPMSFYKALSETNRDLSKKRFVWIALDNLYTNNEFYNCPEKGKIYFPNISYVIVGRKVNMKRFNLLKKKSIDKILTTYFTEDKKLILKYSYLVTELIAICYENNIKVITTSKNNTYYEIFK